MNSRRRPPTVGAVDDAGLFAGYISWGTLGYAVLLTAVIGGFRALFFLLKSAVLRRRNGNGDQGLKDDMKAELPYGPAMIVGCWLAIALAGLGAFPVPA